MIFRMDTNQTAMGPGLDQGLQENVIGDSQRLIGGKHLKTGITPVYHDRHFPERALIQVGKSYVETVINDRLPLCLPVHASTVSASDRPFVWLAKSITVVVPPQAAAMVPLVKSSLVTRSPQGIARWVWTSIPPVSAGLYGFCAVPGQVRTNGGNPAVFNHQIKNLHSKSPLKKNKRVPGT